MAGDLEVPFYLTSKIQTSLFSAVALAVQFSRSCGRCCTLELLRSALGRFLGQWYFTYQRSSPGAVDRPDDVPALFWQVSAGIPFFRVTSKSRQALLGSCSGGAVLALVRPVIPYTYWRHPQRSRPVVSPAVALFNSTLLADQLPPQFLFCRVALRPSESSLTRNGSAIPQTPSYKKKKKKTRQSLIDAPAGS